MAGAGSRTVPVSRIVALVGVTVDRTQVIALRLFASLHAALSRRPGCAAAFTGVAAMLIGAGVAVNAAGGGAETYSASDVASPVPAVLVARIRHAIVRPRSSFVSV